MYRRVIIFFLFFLSLPALKAQGKESGDVYISSPFSFSNPQFGVSISAESYFNFSDVFVGFGLGTKDMNNDWSASINVDFRPYFKKVLIQESDHFFTQYREKLFFLSLDLSKEFNFYKWGEKNKFGVYFEGRFGYLFGNYRGVNASPNDKFLVIPAAGLTVNIDFVNFYLGYLYFNTGSDANNSMINLGMKINIRP